MICLKNLLDNGYKKYNNPNYTSAKYLFQKRVSDEEGNIKYFINIYEFSFKSVAYEVSLSFKKEKYFLNITLFDLDKNMTLEEIEREVYAIWYGLDCEYYEKIEKLDLGEEI